MSAAEGARLQVEEEPRERKVVLTENGGNKGGEGHKQNPGRNKKVSRRKRCGGNELLDELAALLNHSQAVRSLHSRTLQLVVKVRILVRSQIQRRSMTHDFGVYVGRVPLFEDRVAKINHTGQDNAKARQNKLQRDEKPESVDQRFLMRADQINRVDDPACDPQQGDGHQSSHEPKKQAGGHYSRSRFPNHLEYRGNILQRGNSLVPAVSNWQFYFNRCCIHLQLAFLQA